jgi:hypothetical protein
MGVLDDAIRQHLELKRKHGASEGEVERQEQEALGAPRREPVPAEAEEAQPEPVADAPPAVEEPPVRAEEPPRAAPEPAPERIEVADPAPESVEAPPEPEPEPAAAAEPEVAEQPAPPVEQPADDEPDWDFGSQSDEPATGGDTPPRGFDRVDEAPPAEGDEEDVLEETPDFLQETPEHDRLWFEQKPPRDFDFDDDNK